MAVYFIRWKITTYLSVQHQADMTSAGRGFPMLPTEMVSGCWTLFIGLSFWASLPIQMILSYTKEYMTMFIAENNNVIIQTKF
jgi:hypothetical protein